MRSAPRASGWVVVVVLVSLVGAQAARAQTSAGFVAASASASMRNHPPEDAIDGQLSTRWVADGKGQFITGDLGASATVIGMDIAWYRGESRSYAFRIEVAGSDGAFRPVLSASSSGTRATRERYSFQAATARWMRVVVDGNTVNDRAAIREMSAVATPAQPPPGVAVAVSPTSATLVPGGQQQFTATVTGAADLAVTWTVAEGASGGTVSSSGLYTAPAAPGTFHVVATSVADPSASASATVTVQAAGGGGSADLCAGLVQDKLAHRMTSVAKPRVGATYVDPQFGTTIRRISDAAAAGASDIVPMYSTVQAWNADESYLILYHVGDGHHIYDGRTYARLRPLAIDPADLEQVYWDAADPKVLYYVGAGTRRLFSFHVDSGIATLVHDFATAPSSCTTSVSGGVDPMWTSWDSRYFGLVCGSKVFSYDKAADRVGTIASVSSGGNAPQPAPSGALYYLNRADTAGQVRDANMTLLRTIASFESDSHATLGTAEGVDTLFSVQFDSSPNGSVVAVDLTTGAKRVIVGPATGYPYPPSGTHLSAIAYRKPGWVAVSVVGFFADGATLLDNEVLLVNANTGGAVCRVAHHRSVANDYWGEPHVTISPSGTRILYASDWGGAVSDSYVIELPGYVAPAP